jgi:hypothetical protein
MKIPLAIYNNSTGEVSISDYTKVVWAIFLEKRYKCEVQRIEPYSGILVVFDGENSDNVIGENNVVICGDAQSGPEVIDVLNWENSVYSIIGSQL